MAENKIQKGFVLSVALLFFGTSAMGTFNAHPSPTPILGTTLYVGGAGGDNYTTIQDAIDDASDGYIIIVYPGTYNEDQITIDKALTITSVEGWSTTIIDGGNASLTDCGLVRIIAIGDVKFQGFTVQHAGGPPNGGDNGDDLTNVGIYAQSDSSTATYTISNNKIFGTNNPDDWEDYGFYTNIGQEHLIFKNNVVTQTAANSILIEKHLGSTELSYNALDAGCWGIDPIYYMTYSGTDITSLQKISHNVIDVSTGIHPHDADTKVTGIGFSSAYLGCTGSDDSGKYTNIEISYNTIHNLQAYERGIALDNFAWGDGAGGEISNAVIKDNILEGISIDSPSFAIRLSGLVSDTDIQGNIITGCDMSFLGTIGFYGDSTAYPTGTTIQDNNFEGNGGGLVWDGDPLNAEDNWWGNASGPQASGNPDGTGDPITGDVDYTPWLSHPYGPPYAAFTYTIDDKNVSFDASTSGDYDGTITTYDWNFGDTANGQGITILHEYAAYQQYTATLTVTDNDDRTNSVSHTFTLSDHVPPVINNVQAVPNPQHVGKWVNISCKVTDNVAVSQVKVNITYPDTSTVNQTMTYNPVTHLAKYNISYSQLGVYDYFIWASDTNGNTKVSTVHSFQITNQAPYTPSSPSPSNGATSVDVNSVLLWVGGDPDTGDTVTYDVHFGTDSSPGIVVHNQSTTSYDPGTMQFSTTYYWKIVAWDNNGASAIGPVWHFTTEANNPTVFGAPTPSNGSTGRPLSFTWSIPINDPEGDSFDWTIQCSNGQTTGASGASNGTETLSLSGLSYSTTYTVWVNATDPTGSGLYTRSWYTFTTKASQPPVFGTPTPSNGSTGNALSLTWSIPISDPEGDLFSWTIQCSNGQVNSGTGSSNGTKTLALSGLAYGTTYTVWVNATDPDGSGQYTRMWYEFSTAGNYPPVFGAPSPSNGSTGEPLSLTWSIPISDPDGDLFSWTIQCSNGQTNSGAGASNGTKTLSLSGLSYYTTYKIWVNATDPTGSGLYTRRWYSFTTKTNFPPVFGTPSPSNESTDTPVSLTWSIPISDSDGDSFDWTIQCSNGQTSGASSASNGTKTLSLSGLSYSTTYTVWVNATDPDGSGLYTRMWYEFTTHLNNPPNSPSNPSPSDGDSNVNITTDLSWTGGDPDTGDTVTYDVAFGTTTPPIIVAHNQSESSYDPGTLSYNTTYYWRVIAWDNHGASTEGPLWSFTTEIGQDTTPPYVALIAPLPGYIYINWRDVFLLRIPFFMTIVIGNINVVANASDAQSGINRVEFWVNDDLRCTDTTAPYNWTWSEKGIFQETLRVVAYDNAGNQNHTSLTLWKIKVLQK
jgi:hypothetical protein